jgi:NAD(P)-dependent dehydrogenase (short-subunit alcohol dehydrogenase family)
VSERERGRLEGKRTIVTGAASGIGRASAIRFAREGATVVLNDLNAAGLEETLEEIEDAGGRARAIVGSSCEDDVVRELVRESIAHFGGLDVVYANAGISGGPTPILDLTADDWRAVLEVNLIGPFLAIKHGATHMKAHGGGSILCTASVAGLRSGAGPSPYSASKAGVISLVQTTANQLAGSGVRVNAVCPGLTETGMTKPMFDMARAAGKERKIGQLNPLQRAGQPEEIANLVAFLASDEASYINGQAIAADGGLSSSHPFVPGRLA